MSKKTRYKTVAIKQRNNNDINIVAQKIANNKNVHHSIKRHNITRTSASLILASNKKRWKSIGRIYRIGNQGRNTISTMNGNSEGVNSEIAEEVSNLNRQAIRSGKNIKLNHRIKKKKQTDDDKNKKEKNLHIAKRGVNNNQISSRETNAKNYNSQNRNSNRSLNPVNKNATKKIKQTKNPFVKKKTSQLAIKNTSKAIKKTGTKLVQAITFSLKSMKGLIIALGSIGAAFLAFVVIIGAILMMVSSPFAILLDDNPKSMRTQINEFLDKTKRDFRKEVFSLGQISTATELPYYAWRNGELQAGAYDSDNDRVIISGPAPDVKEVLKLYIARSYEDKEEDILIDTEDFKINRFKEAYENLNNISEPSIFRYTHEEDIDLGNGKTKTVKVLDYREISYVRNSETALHFAQNPQHFMTDEQIEIIRELDDPELDKAWSNLLYGIDSFGYLPSPNSMPYFNQCDYSNVSYGPGTLASDGCGPTAFAMVVSYLTNKLITPPDIIDWCGNDYYGWPDSGTCWSFFEAAANHYGIKCDNSCASFNEAVEALKQGKVVISIQGPGLFTYGGHFIVLRAITEDEKILVSDPNGGNAYSRWGLSIEEYLNKKWDPEQISQASNNYWIFSSDFLVGGNPAKQVWAYLKQAGYSDEVTAGIIGNMMTECGGQTLDLDWNIHGHFNGMTFYGLCQWCLEYTPSWFDGSSIYDQIQYLTGTIESEFNNFGSNYQNGYTYSDFISTTSVDEAAAAFAACYERPGYEYNNYELRRNNAKQAYNYFHGKRY